MPCVFLSRPSSVLPCSSRHAYPAQAFPLPLTLLYSTQFVDSNLVGNAKVPSVPAQRVITAHLMRLWPSHQYVIGDISLTRSEQTLGLQNSHRFNGKACPTDPDDTIFGLHFPTPALTLRFRLIPLSRRRRGI